MWFYAAELSAGQEVSVATQDNEGEDVLYYGHNAIRFYGHILNP